MTAQQSKWPAWLALATGVVIAWLAIDGQTAPAALSADAPPTVFAAGRAQRLVEAIARAPHPMGSLEAENVRKLVVQKLNELGLTAEIQAPRMSDNQVRNVVARLKGSASASPGKKSLMLCAHYDSVPTSPGAGDDASGVAVVIETMRAVMAGPPLDRDIVVLFTDGEENGFDGSRLFVDEHPWAKEISTVLNFDARGNSGPSIMFETSDHNGWLIDQYERAAVRPVATSLSMDIYKIMPNNTDMSIFKKAGMAGLNFAFSSGIAYYHSPEDTPGNLDARTLQHQGENALAMTRHFGRLDLDSPRDDDVIYTSILGRFVVSYTKVWALPLALIAAGLYVVVATLSVQTKLIQQGDIIAGAGVLLGAMCVSLLAVGFLAVLGVLCSFFFALMSPIQIPWQKYDVSIMTGFALVTTTITLALERWSGRDRPFVGLCLGAFGLWLAFVARDGPVAAWRQLSLCLADPGGIARNRRKSPVAAAPGTGMGLVDDIDLLDPLALTLASLDSHYI